MTPGEFHAWLAFYRMQPFDDDHRFHRPAALVAHSMNRAEVPELLDWLRRGIPVESVVEEPAEEAYSQAELNSIHAHGFVPPPRVTH